MHFYITYNDAPSGIYSSQVIDVVKFFNTELKENVKLISFISIRGFFRNRKIIKQQLPDAFVFPMYPKQINWKRNLFLLNLMCLIYKPQILVGRSVFATKLALLVKGKNNCKKVVYDGRGAIATEWKEYNVVTDKKLVKCIFDFEKEVVLQSDYRIAVSNALVNFWRSEFGYSSNSHVVIPCTLNSDFETIEIDRQKISLLRKQLNFNSDDTVFVYSGSLAGWQSFSLLDNFLNPLLINNVNFKVLFLSYPDECIKALIKKFPDQITCKHLSPNQVGHYLVACDYGMLLREETMTNKVASPVKFAEYLACGLKIIISNNLGDYSEFVKNNNCEFNTNVSESEKNRMREIALSNFSKINFIESYKSILKLK